MVLWKQLLTLRSELASFLSKVNCVNSLKRKRFFCRWSSKLDMELNFVIRSNLETVVQYISSTLFLRSKNSSIKR